MMNKKESHDESSCISVVVIVLVFLYQIKKHELEYPENFRKLKIAKLNTREKIPKPKIAKLSTREK